MQIYKMADKLTWLGLLGFCTSVIDFSITSGLKKLLPVFQQLLNM